MLKYLEAGTIFLNTQDSESVLLVRKKAFFFISFPLMNLKLGPNNKQQSTTNFHFLKK